MAEYILTPDKKEMPDGTRLLEELHHYGFPVEMHLKGTHFQWDAIRFNEPGPPEAECFLSFEPEKGDYSVSVPADSARNAEEIQLFLVKILLGEIGGSVLNTETMQRYNPAQFAKKIRKLHSNAVSVSDWFWMFFPWTVAVLAASTGLLGPPNLRMPARVLALIAALSAAGLTYFNKSE